MASKYDAAGVALRRDGIAAVTGLLDPAEVADLLGAVDLARSTPGPYHRRLSPAGQMPMESDLFRWRDIAAIRDLVTGVALTRLARALLDVDRLVLLEDQWFSSSAGSSTASPWHQDEPYHPLDRPFITIWLPLTPVPAGLGLRGAVGSHLGKIYAPVEFSAGRATLGSAGFSLDPVPDVDADPDVGTVAAPAIEPGDAIVLDSRTLHAAGGSCPAEFVRLSIRYAHPDTRFLARPWAVAGFWQDHATPDGELLASSAFPIIGRHEMQGAAGV